MIKSKDEMLGMAKAFKNLSIEKQREQIFCSFLTYVNAEIQFTVQQNPVLNIIDIHTEWLDDEQIAKIMSVLEEKGYTVSMERNYMTISWA